MAFISLYSAVDIFYLAHYVSTNAMASISIVLPYINLVWGLAVMLSAGSAALIGIMLGEGKTQEANKAFSLIFIFLVTVAIIITVLSLFYIDNLVRFMGAGPNLFNDARTYLYVLAISTPILVAKLFLEYYVRLDGKPAIALAISFIGLIFNIVFDYIAIAVLGWGVWGAGISTALSIALSALIGIVYFKYFAHTLHFVVSSWNGAFIYDTIVNGSSEMFTEISAGIVGILFNVTIIRYAGEDGIAAMAAIINLYYFLISIYLGISAGAQPLISYSFGAFDKKAMSQVLHYSKVAILASSLIIFTIAQFFGNYIITWYIGDNPQVIALAHSGFHLVSFCFLFLGMNVFISGLYSSIGNGKISAVIAICRSFIFVALALKVLPPFLGLNGVWWTIPTAEATTLLLSLIFYNLFMKNYCYHA